MWQMSRHLLDVLPLNIVFLWFCLFVCLFCKLASFAFFLLFLFKLASLPIFSFSNNKTTGIIYTAKKKRDYMNYQIISDFQNDSFYN